MSVIIYNYSCYGIAVLVAVVIMKIDNRRIRISNRKTASGLVFLFFSDVMIPKLLTLGVFPPPARHLYQC